MVQTPNISCIIIDDEPLAQQLVEKYVKRLPFLSLVHIFDNAIDALAFLNTKKIDLIFLDINMPEMTGLEFVKTFTAHKPYIIFTTAYSEYALEGFENDAVDYLLKPFPFERFVKAINKVKERQKPIVTADTEHETTEIAADHVWLKEDRKMVKVFFSDILHVEGMKDYIKVFLKDGVVVTHMTMSKIESQLNLSGKFIRINKSYIVNSDAISALDGNMIILKNKKSLMIGGTFRDDIKAKIYNK